MIGYEYNKQNVTNLDLARGMAVKIVVFKWVFVPKSSSHIPL